MCCYRIYAWIWREDSNLLNSYVVLAKILFKNATPPPSPNKRKYPSVPPYPGKLSGSAWNPKCILWMTLNSDFLTNLTLYVSPLVSFNAIILT